MKLSQERAFRDWVNGITSNREQQESFMLIVQAAHTAGLHEGMRHKELREDERNNRSSAKRYA